MASAPTPLDELRQQIDEIDLAIHDLVMRRARVVERVSLAKRSEGAVYRPGREATILRRLVDRHEGGMPVAAVARMWREMLSASSQMQAAYSVAVCETTDGNALWDLARDHYGSLTPAIAVATPLNAIRAVSDGTAAIGIVPWPETKDIGDWWHLLMGDDRSMPRVVAKLPFLDRGTGRRAIAIGRAVAEPTGYDHTMIGLELKENVSRGRLQTSLTDASLPLVGLWSSVPDGGANVDRSAPFYLAEVNDFVLMGDERLRRLEAALGEPLQRLQVLGGFAVPIDLSADASGPSHTA